MERAKRTLRAIGTTKTPPAQHGGRGLAPHSKRRIFFGTSRYVSHPFFKQQREAMSAVPAKPAPPGQRAHQKNKPRPIDFYRPLPFCRPKGKNDFKYVSITAAGRSLVTVSRQKLEAGLFEGVTTYDKAIRLNVPTPSYQDVEDYDQLVPEVGPLPRAFLRSKPPKRSTLPKVPGEKAEAALALGRPLGAAPPADMSGNPACAESDDEPEYVLGAISASCGAFTPSS